MTPQEFKVFILCALFLWLFVMVIFAIAIWVNYPYQPMRSKVFKLLSWGIVMFVFIFLMVAWVK